MTVKAKTVIANTTDKPTPAETAPLVQALDVIYRVCCLAGDPNLLEQIRGELRTEGVTAAIRRHDTGTLYDWLMVAFSYQGISDRVATEYMARHGRVRWADIRHGLAQEPPCPKLNSYCHFHACRYDKGSQTCAEPEFIRECPPPHSSSAERSSQSDGLFAVPVHSRRG
jgi:hypothetical protein